MCRVRHGGVQLLWRGPVKTGLCPDWASSQTWAPSLAVQSGVVACLGFVWEMKGRSSWLPGLLWRPSMLVKPFCD
jgi:hypothetical protein